MIPGWTSAMAPRVIPCTDRRDIRSRNRVLERSPLQVSETTGAGKAMTARRLLFAVLFAATTAGSLGLMALALSAGGFGFVDFVLLALFALTLPWMVAGFWKAIIGFIIMRVADPVAAVLPVAAAIRGHEAVTASTAISVVHPQRAAGSDDPQSRTDAGRARRRRLHRPLSCLCPERYQRRRHRFQGANTVRRSGLALGGPHRDQLPAARHNIGFKAGNIRDFCERWGTKHEFAVVLDADSFMTADAVLRLVRIMQADPNLGILQGLVVGLPSTSAFARLFQFGMRLGMRSYTIGNAWWQGDCGPYWGHNAVLRLKPFIAHCQLPTVDDVHILSHDQLEAALMRRAGYAVRVMPDEELGWEENPPTLIEFIRRDLRWCQGNMQYWRFPHPSRAAASDALQSRHRDPDVHRLASLDRPARARHAVGSFRRDASRLHPSRLRHGGVRARPGDVVRAQDRHRRRCPVAARGASRLRRHGAFPWQCRCSNMSSRFCWSQSSGSVTPCSWPACCSATRSAGSGRPATIIRCRRGWRCAICGRTPCSAAARSACWP